MSLKYVSQKTIVPQDKACPVPGLINSTIIAEFAVLKCKTLLSLADIACETQEGLWCSEERLVQPAS